MATKPRAKQTIDKAPQVLCSLLKKHFAPSWSSSSDLFGAKQLSREKALKWHCDLLVDMLQVSQVWNKVDLQVGLASLIMGSMSRFGPRRMVVVIG